MKNNTEVEKHNLRHLIKKREEMLDKKKNAIELFNNNDDEVENTHIDQVLNE